MKLIVKGTAVPYTRMTQGQVKLMRIPDHKLSPSGLKIKEKLRRYFDWKDFVNLHTLNLGIDKSPKEKVFLNVMVYYRDKKHADPENIRKGIQDAIFTNDKMVAGSVDFSYDYTNPRVEIEILCAL